VEAVPAERAGVIGVGERHDDGVAQLEGGDLAADLFDDADGLMAHPPAFGGVVQVVVGVRSAPQTQAWVTRMITSVSACSSGSGTSTTRTSPAPYIRVAFIEKVLSVGRPPGVLGGQEQQQVVVVGQG
jgi:hypothetical protein